MTAEQVAGLAATGQFWWLRGQDTYVATASRLPAQQPGDVYLGDYPPQWLAQWNNNWQAAADYLTPLINSQLDQEAP